MLRVRLPGTVLDAFDDTCSKLKVSRSERVRQLLERDIATTRRYAHDRFARRLRRLRRCVACTAFVRHGYTCKTCRVTTVDSIVVAGHVVAVPHLPRHPLPLRPDVRDPRWADAEAVVLDAFAPVVGIIYEMLTGEDSFEMTDLDDVADLLAMAASLHT